MLQGKEKFQNCDKIPNAKIYSVLMQPWRAKKNRENSENSENPVFVSR